MPLLIHCTKKLLVQIPQRFIDPSASGAGWHANLLRFERRKCVLFTHDETLYSVFVPGLRKPAVRAVGCGLPPAPVQGTGVGRIFSNADSTDAGSVPRDPVHAVQQSQRAGLDERHPVSDRSPCGEQDGGRTSVDLAQLHHELNRNPLSAIGYRYAVERLQEDLGASA